MKDFFIIYVDRLQDGAVEELHGDIAPEFLNVEEQELRFNKPVSVDGRVYVAQEHLVISLKATTRATMPCSVCNKMIHVPVEVQSFYHTQLLAEIKNSLYDFRELLREQILIEVPKYAECNDSCDERKLIKKFMMDSDEEIATDTYFPFSHLEKEQ